MLEDFPIHGPVGADATPSSEVSRHEVDVAVAEGGAAAPLAARFSAKNSRMLCRMVLPTSFTDGTM